MTESTDRSKERPVPVVAPRQDRLPGQASQRTSRRDLLTRAMTWGAILAWPVLGRAQAQTTRDGQPPTPRTSRTLPNAADLSDGYLTTSEFAYVSPLRSDGRESTCHGEVWFAWLDNSVVLITAKSTWKARALARGLDSARVWVGDHGRWKGWFRNNEAFRQAPNFRASATIDNDPKLLDRLMNVYETKYPAEFSDWEDRQRSGFHSGERIIIRYAREASKPRERNSH